ncbi:MAG: GntR family transcriptional regulator [Clostridia bacterium]|nr:GntR family transcriptional regulator [Clostridia bacterium]
MILKIDFESDLPIYIQLKTQIIEGIAAGVLKEGDPLPSVRQMASDLGINLHTVNKAYTFLKQDGFITVHRQKGVVINSIHGRRVNEDYLARLHKDLSSLAAEAYCRGMNEEEFKNICTELFTKFKSQSPKW